ncbi:hypothetical protein CF327_g5187 [Tilletia walkeri]|nr:hypothetical protein CF327_g5187 [Tilletia walkeri]
MRNTSTTLTRSRCFSRARRSSMDGYPIDEFEVAAADADKAQGTPSKSAKSNAKKRAKKAALREIEAQQKQGASKTTTPIPKGNYGIRASQYVQLAQYVADHELEVPDHLLHRLYRCIKLRMRALQRFLPNPDWSTFTHEHFINVLREVGSILHQAKTRKAREDTKKGTAKGGSSSSSSVNRFASLEVLDKINEDYDDIIDEDPVSPTSNSAASDAKAQFNLKQSREEAVMSAMMFFSDLHDIRMYILNLWMEWYNKKATLVMAAVTSHVAMEMLRRPHDELMERILPLFEELREEYPSCDSALEILFIHLVNAACPQRPAIRALTPFSEVKFGDAPTQRAYEMLCIPAYQALKRVVQDSDQLPFKYLTDSFDEQIRPTSHPSRKWKQLEILIHELYAEYLYPIRVLAQAGGKVHPFVTDGDECAKTFHESLKAGIPTLYAAFCANIFVDINLMLGGHARTAQEQCHQSCAQMSSVLKQREASGDLLPHIMSKGAASTLWAQMMLFLKTFLHAYASQYDFISTMAFYSAAIRESVQGTPRMLMYRSPIACGTALFKLRLQYVEFGRIMMETWGLVTDVAHLHYLCKITSPPSTYPQWHDLEVLLHYHNAEALFGRKIPATPLDAHIGYMKLMGLPLNALQAIRRGDDKLPPIRLRSRRVEGIGEQNQKGTINNLLKDRTRLIALFKSKFLQTEEVTPVKIANFEDLLLDLATKEYDAARKLEAQAQVQGKASQEKVRRQFTTRNLLDRLRRSLVEEHFAVSFDYFSFLSQCVDMLKHVEVAVRDRLKEERDYYPEDEVERLGQLAMWITHEPAMVESVAIERKIPLETVWPKCPLLNKTKEAMTKVLSTGVGYAEMVKMGMVKPPPAQGQAQAPAAQSQPPSAQPQAPATQSQPPAKDTAAAAAAVGPSTATPENDLPSQMAELTVG